MTTSNNLADEQSRLAALASYEIVDTPAEPDFDALAKLAAFVLDVPMAAISIVDADRQWFKARHGLDALETPRDLSFSAHVVALDQPVVVPDVLLDGRFADNPLVQGPSNVRFYAGHPLRTPDGFVLGALCAFDRRARQIEARHLEMLQILANETMAQLELRRQGRLLAEEQTRLRTMLEAAPDAIIALDDQHRAKKISDEAYQKRRAELKNILKGMM